MRKRTLSREIALIILYAVDVTKSPVKECNEAFWQGEGESADADTPSGKLSDVMLRGISSRRDEVNEAISEDRSVKEFADSLVFGVEGKLDGLDGLISKYADNWEIDRMAVIDRNVLRLSSFELLFITDTPPKVVINEGIELAKNYGDKDSGKFVNGILDKINKTERPAFDERAT